MTLTAVASALGALGRFGWTTAFAIAVAVALFGFATAFKIRPHDARIHEAARALLRAFVNDRHDAISDAIPPEIPIAKTSSRVGADAIGKPVARVADVIIDKPIEGVAEALREAFEAGKAHKAEELKAMMAAFLDGLASAGEAGRSGPPGSTLPDAGSTKSPRTEGIAG
jgi:hypothetical protein